MNGAQKKGITVKFRNATANLVATLSISVQQPDD
jgi:hypothetical protein